MKVAPGSNCTPSQTDVWGKQEADPGLGLCVRLGEELATHEVRDLLDRGLARESRRLAVSPAPALPRDGGDVDVLGPRAQTHPVRRPVLREGLANERCDLGPLDGPQVVDDSFREGFFRPGRLEVGPLEVRDDHPPALVDASTLEGAREKLELRERDVLVDDLKDTVD